MQKTLVNTFLTLMFLIVTATVASGAVYQRTAAPGDQFDIPVHWMYVAQERQESDPVVINDGNGIIQSITPSIAIGYTFPSAESSVLVCTVRVKIPVNTLPGTYLATTKFNTTFEGNRSDMKSWSDSFEISVADISRDIPSLDIPVKGVQLSDHAVKLKVGEKKQLIYAITPLNASNRNVLWQTGSSDIVEVSNAGLLTASKSGNTRVTIQTEDGGFSDICDVTVTTGGEYEDLMLAAVFSDMVYNEDLILRSSVREYAKIASNKDIKIWKSKTITFADWYSEVAGDWNIVPNSIVSNPTTGFQATAFDSPDGKRRIIAYRGTESWNDIKTDARLLIVQMDPQLGEAYSYFEKFGKNTAREVLLVGHSLGGALAGYVSMRTGTKAITINGATGLAIDVAYKKDYLQLASVFKGVETWNFTNHVTSGLVDANNAIVCTNNTQYDFFKYPFNQDTNREFLWKEHATMAFVSYSDTENRFVINRPGVRVGDKTGGTKEIRNILLGGKFSLYLGTTDNDNLFGLLEIQTKISAFGGDANDQIVTSLKSDVLVGGAGRNTLYPGEGNDIILITNGDYVIRDPSGNDKIMLLNGVRISKAIEDDDFYTVSLNNGHFIQVMKFRNDLFSDGSISVVDEEDVELGKIGGGSAWTPNGGSQGRSVKKTVKAMNEFPTTKRVIIEGSVSAFRIYDENGKLVETFVNNSNANIYREYGYFHMDSGANPSIIAILINGNYSIKVEGEKTVKYSIVNFDTQDRPVILLSTEVPLRSGVYLDTRSSFGQDNKVPFVIREIATGEEITQLVPDVTDLTAEILVDLSSLGLKNGKLMLKPGEEVNKMIGGTPDGLKFKATGLPQGLTLTEDGRLYGSVSLIGEYFVTLTASAPGGAEDFTSFTVVVTAGSVPAKDNGGSGGCNSGAGFIVLAILAFPVMRYFKHQPRV